MNPAIVDPSAPLVASTMRSVVQDTYGVAPEQVLRLAEVSRPAIGDDEVLVRVAAASVDRGTWHVMAGVPYLMRAAGFGVRTPKGPNPGRCFAGTVKAVGKDVAGFLPGDEVYGTSEGSFAEYVAAKPGRLAAKPASLSFEQAAAVPISGMTALQAVRDRAKVTAGERVLIIGASGGVGSFAVQIAKAFGAEVTGVCGPTKVDLVRELGADHVVDYSREDFAGGEDRYDVILDVGGNSSLSRLRRALAARGRLVIVGGMTDGRWFGGIDRQLRATLLSPFVGQKLGSFVASENGEDLLALRELIDAGKVAPAIDRTYPLGEVPAAIRYLLKGEVRGKLVITV
ncbi:MAG TPA: NAD(P)-dependent alcohol dehydrogenase [Acidimicrobiales bacterium]|nr:NAD(P)-dependent alcohol dehydrogenase [Acidimicrobiales bacterium]